MALVVEAILDALNGKHGKEISFVDITKKVRRYGFYSTF